MDIIDFYTWLYIVKDAPIIIETPSVVSRAGDVIIDEFINRSWREQQLSFWIGDENHLAYAQALFSVNFGVGVRFTVSVILGLECALLLAADWAKMCHMLKLCGT
jgi:hypothetical protein